MIVISYMIRSGISSDANDTCFLLSKANNCCSYSYELVRTFFLKIKEYLIRKFFNQKIAFITYELLILN